VGDVRYRQIHHQSEVEYSKFSFEQFDQELGFKLFDDYEKECNRLLKEKLVLPAYDFCLKCSHVFNLLDARGAISVAERQRYIRRVRLLAKGSAEGYLAERERLGFPLMKKEAARG
jgi:glycyl-tRNA synthetase alpha chain